MVWDCGVLTGNASGRCLFISTSEHGSCVDGAYAVVEAYKGINRYKSARNGTLAWLKQTRPWEWEANHPCGNSTCWALWCAGTYRYFAVSEAGSPPTTGWRAEIAHAKGSVTIVPGSASQIPNFLMVLPQSYTIAFWVCIRCLNASVSSIVPASYPGGNGTAAAQNDCVAYNSNLEALGMVLRFPAGQVVGPDKYRWNTAKKLYQDPEHGERTLVVVTGEGEAPLGIQGTSTFWVGSQTASPSILGSIFGVCSGGVIKSRPQVPANVLRMYSWSRSLTEDEIYNFWFTTKDESGTFDPGQFMICMYMDLTQIYRSRIIGS